MDSFEWNKIAGAVLFAMLVGFGVSALSDGIFSRGAPSSPGYLVALQDAGHPAGGPAVPEEPIGVLMASADPGAGETISRRCIGCHTFGQGEPRKVGPNLYDIVLHPIASNPAYEGDYSPAMEVFAEQGDLWTYEHLNAFLASPRGAVPGTKMNFNGLPNPQDRANLLAYLRSMSPNPPPLPAVEAAEAAPAVDVPQDAAGAEGDAAEPTADGDTAPADDEAGGASEPAAPEEAAPEGVTPETPPAP